MSTKLRPLGDRVLIRPDQQPEQTESGLWLSEHRKPEQTGTVIAVGQPAHPRKAEAEQLADEIEGTGEPCADGCCRDDAPDRAAALLRDLVRREPSVAVGDYVLFSWTAGQEIQLHDDGTTLLLMPESDILAVIGEGVTCE